jgi:hypothetical protein
MTDPTPAPVALTTEQLVAAMAAGLLPLAGPTGIAAAALVPAVQQLWDAVNSRATSDFSVADLVAIVTKGNADLAKLTADVNALP